MPISLLPSHLHDLQGFALHSVITMILNFIDFIQDTVECCLASLIALTTALDLCVDL